jgi:hypothetical protein
VNFPIRAPHIIIITVRIGGRTLLLAHFEFHHLEYKISSQDSGYDGEGIEKFNEQVVLSWAQPDHLGMVWIIRTYPGPDHPALLGKNFIFMNPRI